jgi:hypothetical protein
VETPWPITRDDAIDLYERSLPDVKFAKRMRAGGVKTTLMNFVNVETTSRLSGDARNAAILRRKEYCEDVEYCENCNRRVIHDPRQACVVCVKCGNSTAYNPIDTSYREGTSLHVPYLYKQSNHFREHVLRIQGKESTEIGQDIIDSILVELDKRGTPKEKASPKDVRNILKNLGLSKLYNHTYRIWALSTGQTPPQMTAQQQCELMHIFGLVQEAWESVKPHGRSNMLSYTYLLNKMCLLLGYHDLAKHFSVLKSRDKILQQDVMWQSICAKLDFEFMRSQY